MKSTEEMEQPAKRWEVATLSEQFKAQSDLIKAVSGKLDVLILQPHITKEDVKEHVKVEVDKVYAKYDPMYENARKFVWALVLLGLGLVGDIVLRLWNLK